MKKSNALLPLVGVAILLAVWSLTTALRLVDPVLLPSPYALSFDNKTIETVCVFVRPSMATSTRPSPL